MSAHIPWCRCRGLGPWHTWEPGGSCPPSHDSVHYLPVGADPLAEVGLTEKNTEKGQNDG